MTSTPTASHADAAALLDEVLRHLPDGVAVVESREGSLRIAYANATLAALLRRPEDWFAGRALDEVEMEPPADPDPTATMAGQRVRLKRVDGSLVDFERWAVMLAGGRVALYYRTLVRNAPGGLAASLERSGGVSSEQHLHDLLNRDWSIGQRDGRTVTLMRFEIDSWAEYGEIFGRSASDNVLRQLGRTIASVARRASDVIARSGHGGFVVLGVAMEESAAFGFADQIVARIRSLSIHHPRSSTGRFLTVSAGVATVAPPRELGHRAIIEAVESAVGEAKTGGGNRTVAGRLQP